MSKTDSHIPTANATSMAQPVAASNIDAFMAGNDKVSIPDHFMR